MGKCLILISLMMLVMGCVETNLTSENDRRDNASGTVNDDSSDDTGSSGNEDTERTDDDSQTNIPDTGSEDTGSEDTGSEDTGSEDTGSEDTGSEDTGSEDTGSGTSATECPGGMPLDACTAGVEDRDGCANARRISRVDASGANGYFIADDLCSADDNFDGSNSDCWDANADHAYRIYLLTGEMINISITTGNHCSDSSRLSVTLKVHANGGCADKNCGDDDSWEFCESNETSHNKDFTATSEGWYVVLVDGSHSSDDEGDYDMTVKLTCNAAGCGC